MDSERHLQSYLAANKKTWHKHGEEKPLRSSFTANCNTIYNIKELTRFSIVVTTVTWIFLNLTNSKLIKGIRILFYTCIFIGNVTVTK